MLSFTTNTTLIIQMWERYFNHGWCFMTLLPVFISTSGIIKHGGESSNIIPAYSELNYCVRTTRVKELPELKAKVEACFRAAADATGCQVTSPAPVIPLFPLTGWRYIICNNICKVALLAYSDAASRVLLHYSLLFYRLFCFSCSAIHSYHRVFILRHKLFIYYSCFRFGLHF